MNLDGDSATRGSWTSLLARGKRLLEEHWAPLLILVCYLVLSCYYSVSIPVWEAVDEPDHYAYARYLATFHAMPKPGDPKAQLLHEKFQPPLYYSLAAGMLYWTKPIPEPHYQRNPYVSSGTGGHNYALHPTEGLESLRLARRVRLIRLLSTVIGSIGVIFTYRAGRLLFPAQKTRALAAMALHAFWPQFLFHSSVISNDVLSATTGSLLVYVVVQALMKTIDEKVLVEVGIFSFLALLAKVNTLPIIFVAYVSIFVALFSRSRYGRLSSTPRWLLASMTALVLPGLAGWIIHKLPYARIPIIGTPDESLSAVLYSTMDQALSDGAFPRTLFLIVRKAYVTYFASFGWGTISLQPASYTISGIMVALSLISALVCLSITKNRSRQSALIACFVTVVGALSQLVALSMARQTLSLAVGRYLLPAATPFCLLVSYGWEGVASKLKYSGERLSRLLRFGCLGRITMNKEWLEFCFLFVPVVALFVLSLLVPSLYLRPAYAKPAMLSAQEIEQIPNPLFYEFGQRMALIGFEPPADGFQPGETEELALYWRGLKRMSTDYSLDIQILDAEKHLYGATRTYPGHGTLPTSSWPPGEAFRDVYEIKVGDDLPAPGMAHIKVVVYDRETHEKLNVFDAQETPLAEAAFLGRIRTYPVSAIQRFPDKYLALYGESIALQSYEVPSCIESRERITVALEWICRRPVEEDYTVFVHFVDEGGNVLAQDDGEPLSGNYPTSLWVPHDKVIEERHLAVPEDLTSGPYRLLIGLYRPDTMERLPAQYQNGQPVPAKQFVIEGIARCASDTGSAR